jgi:predicted acyl esterase
VRSVSTTGPLARMLWFTTENPLPHRTMPSSWRATAAWPRAGGKGTFWYTTPGASSASAASRSNRSSAARKASTVSISERA